MCIHGKCTIWYVYLRLHTYAHTNNSIENKPTLQTAHTVTPSESANERTKSVIFKYTYTFYISISAAIQIALMMNMNMAIKKVNERTLKTKFLGCI